ncbi:uncharacterized protein LOC144713208 [Wolffia australiana]
MGREEAMGDSFPENKRLKIPPPSLSPHSCDKGKRKMTDFEISSQTQESTGDGRTCGICFGEEYRLIRGFIDCCDHYFCFLCIMEWAKIESRCPMCKQRFGSIQRPIVPGVFPQERKVKVPARDQAQLVNNATGEDDPYADISCIVCHTSEDEHLLLLCDLCDSSAHTYCTGHGVTIPDGDWYCPDCAISRREQSKMKEGDSYSPKAQKEAEKSVSILELVCDEASSKTQIRVRAEKDRRTPTEGTISLIETGARTLHRQRDLHLHIQQMRENWSKFQSGSMGFRPTSSCLSSRRSSFGKTDPGFKFPKKEKRNVSDDIDRAWKMLELAKSAKIVQSGVSHQPQESHKNVTTGEKLSRYQSPVGAGTSIKVDNSLNFLGKNFSTRNRGKSGPEECGRKHLMDHCSRHREISSSSVPRCSPSQCSSLTDSESVPAGQDIRGNEASTTSSGDAKDEIRTLVKTNLKSKGRLIGKSKFKEIAWISTHTVLAACRLDHSASASRPISAPPCHHHDDSSYLSKQVFLPGSCRQCFLSFISHVVDVVASERTAASKDVSHPE